jgi:dTDP-L-rhamnose 4-epimerase
VAGELVPLPQVSYHRSAPGVTGEFRLGDVRDVAAAPDRAATELGFRARVPPAAGLA